MKALFDTPLPRHCAPQVEKLEIVIGSASKHIVSQHTVSAAPSPPTPLSLVISFLHRWDEQTEYTIGLRLVLF